MKITLCIWKKSKKLQNKLRECTYAIVETINADNASFAKITCSETEEKITLNKVCLFRKWLALSKKETLCILIFKQVKGISNGWFRVWFPIMKELKDVNLFSKILSFSKMERYTLSLRWIKISVWLLRRTKRNFICRQFISIFKMPLRRIRRIIKAFLFKNMEIMYSMMSNWKMIRIKSNRFKMS